MRICCLAWHCILTFFIEYRKIICFWSTSATAKALVKTHLVGVKNVDDIDEMQLADDVRQKCDPQVESHITPSLCKKYLNMARKTQKKKLVYVYH